MLTEFVEYQDGAEAKPVLIEVSERELIQALRVEADKLVPPPGSDEPIRIPVADLQINVGCNTSEEVFLEHVRINSARPDVPWITTVPEHLEHAVMVGGGPSLEILLHELASRMHLGQTVVALNGAAKYLKDRHFRVDYQVVIENRPEAIKFLADLPAQRYLLSSGCHPSLFDFLVEKGADVQMFHFAHEGLSAALPKGRHVVMIGGHYTVGLVSMALMTALGFRTLHLYGYDSSDSDDGRAHVYQQSETEAERERLNIICSGRQFSCSYAMFKQAEVFPKFAAMMADFGVTLTVHGDGLLPTVAREMATFQGPENAACYNMANGPASYDFITWLIVAEMDKRRRGVDKPLMVAFVSGPEDGFRSGDVQNVQEKQQILDKVMRPALALFGAVESPEAVTGRQFHYWYRPITDGFRTGEEVPKCKPPLNAVLDIRGWMINNKIIDPLVITLRETRYSPVRNSNVDAWLEFASKRRAEGYDIVFVRDTRLADEPLEDFVVCPQAARDILQRAALYSLAKCNLIIANGPAELLQFSDWPFIEFKPPHIDPLRPVSLGISWWQRFAGITPPESFPWLGKHQLTVWQRDTVGIIEDAWQRWLAATHNGEN